jgi:hypothetical protein
MWDVIVTIAGVIALLVVLELFALPNWIGRKLRGEESSRDLQAKITSLEARVEELEKAAK